MGIPGQFQLQEEVRDDVVVVVVVVVVSLLLFG